MATARPIDIPGRVALVSGGAAGADPDIAALRRLCTGAPGQLR